MHSIGNNRDQRKEPRFHPICEEMCWRKPGATGIARARLLDISRAGLSFRTASLAMTNIERGDEISIRYMGSDNKPAQYAVVWHRHVDGRLDVGCTRLSGTSASARRKPCPQRLILARLRRNLARRRGAPVPEPAAVVVKRALAMAA